MVTPIIGVSGSELGFAFTFILLGLNIPIVFTIAFSIEKLLSEDDKQEIYDNAEKL